MANKSVNVSLISLTTLYVDLGIGVSRMTAIVFRRRSSPVAVRREEHAEVGGGRIAKETLQFLKRAHALDKRDKILSVRDVGCEAHPRVDKVVQEEVAERRLHAAEPEVFLAQSLANVLQVTWQRLGDVALATLFVRALLCSLVKGRHGR